MKDTNRPFHVQRRLKPPCRDGIHTGRGVERVDLLNRLNDFCCRDDSLVKTCGVFEKLVKFNSICCWIGGEKVIFNCLKLGVEIFMSWRSKSALDQLENG